MMGYYCLHVFERIEQIEKQRDAPVHPHETRRLFHPLPFDHHIRQRIEQQLGPATGGLSQFPGT
jgi:hypothetical protein